MISTRATRFALLALLLPMHARSADQVTGAATSRERIALPPEAVFEATVEDVSKADAPAVVIGSEGDGTLRTLVVERFVRAWPGETCDGQAAAPPLETTYWKLTHLGAAPVLPNPQQREPHLILHADLRRASGSGGCNSLTGGYELAGDALTFRQFAGTLMACPSGMDTEKALLDALPRVRTWKISGQHLDLFDAGGTRLARFEARAAK